MRSRSKALLGAGAAAVLAGTVVGATLVQGGLPNATPPAGTYAAPPPFHAVVHPVTAQDLGATWRPGCPVDPGQLRRIDLSHVGTDQRTHVGQLVVNQDRVRQTIVVFDRLYRMRFPIERMRTPDHYPGADDELSMEDNNTSAYNCRGIPGSGRWSEHAYGRAVDVNPLLNPYVDGEGHFQPKNAAAYLDRSRGDPGLLRDGDQAVRAFTDHGWTWGGHWTDPHDYQHFES